MDANHLRFNPETSRDLLQKWSRSEKNRVSKIQTAQLYSAIQNYFWPTKLRHVMAVFIPLMAISAQLYWEETGWMIMAVPVLSVLVFVHIRQMILFGLLKYKRWMLEVKPSAVTQLWFAVVNVSNNMKQ